jgi:hypothetical protein
MSLQYFNRKYGMKLEMVAQGTITADGTEQSLVVDEILSNLFGFVSLGELGVGDVVTIRQYVDMDGGYKLYADETYSGTQLQPAVYITPKGSNTKMKITLQQTAGVYKSFAYEFLREV